MNDDLDAVKRIVAAFERSDWQEIDVRSGDLRVHLAATTPPSASPTAATGVERTDLESTEVARAELERKAAPAEANPTAPVAIPPGAHVVTSPSPGVFWRAPEPGAPPFTDIGQMVEPSATLCIIEVMKLMNHVKAGVAGKVLAIYVDNGAAVAKDETLFAVALAEAAAEGPTS